LRARTLLEVAEVVVGFLGFLAIAAQGSDVGDHQLRRRHVFDEY
jgi:hypothetical protein